MPERGEHPRAVAVGPDAGQGRGHEHADRQRGELEAGGDRVVALGALEVEDEHEHEGEAREPVDERSPGGGGEHAVLRRSRGRASARGRGARSHEGGKQYGGGGQAADHERVVPAGEAAAGDAEHEAGEPGHERERAGQVEAAHRVAARKLAQHEPAPQGAGEAERDVEPEDPVPGQLHQHPAETGPSTRPTAATMVLVPIASPSCARGKASVTSAAALAKRNAPPMPWTIRQRISWVPSAAKPAPSDASAKTRKPAT